MDDPQVQFAEPLPGPRWALVDVVAAVLTGLAWATLITAGGRMAPAGPWWTAVRYTAAGTACASLIFRWRFPVAMLGPVLEHHPAFPRRVNAHAIANGQVQVDIHVVAIEAGRPLFTAR